MSWVHVVSICAASFSLCIMYYMWIWNRHHLIKKNMELFQNKQILWLKISSTFPISTGDSSKVTFLETHLLRADIGTKKRWALPELPNLPSPNSGIFTHFVRPSWPSTWLGKKKRCQKDSGKSNPPPPPSPLTHTHTFGQCPNLKVFFPSNVFP